MHWRRKWPHALSRPKIGKGELDPERVVGKISTIAIRVNSSACVLKYERGTKNEKNGACSSCVVLQDIVSYFMVLSCIYTVEVIISDLREAPFKLAPPLFGHCRNSNYTPPPALKRALWGTFFQAGFYHFLPFLPFFTIFSLNKCHKPSGQGFRPPKIKQMPVELGKFFSKKVPESIRARV